MTSQPNVPDAPDTGGDTPEVSDTSAGGASTTSVPLDLSDEDGDVVIEQQNVGAEEVEGGGEWPDPATPPSDAAPGSLAPPPSPAQKGHRQFKDAQEADQPFRPLGPGA